MIGNATEVEGRSSCPPMKLEVLNNCNSDSIEMSILGSVCRRSGARGAIGVTNSESVVVILAPLSAAI